MVSVPAPSLATTLRFVLGILRLSGAQRGGPRGHQHISRPEANDVARFVGISQRRLFRGHAVPIEAGNHFLQNDYCDQLNERFAVAPRSEVDFHRSAKGYDLASIFCIEAERTLTVDWIVRFENKFYQLQPARKTSAAKGAVLVRRYLNGELHFCHDNRDLAYTLLPERPKRKTVAKIKKTRHKKCD